MNNEGISITIRSYIKSNTDMEEKIKEVFSNRMHGFAAPSEDVQQIIDVINTLTGRGITVKRAQSILTDAAKIIELITEL